MTANYTLGTNATYSCDDGFFLDLSVGDEVRTCIDDGDNDVEGEFDGLEPTCDRKYWLYTNYNNGICINTRLSIYTNI